MLKVHKMLELTSTVQLVLVQLDNSLAMTSSICRLGCLEGGATS